MEEVLRYLQPVASILVSALTGGLAGQFVALRYNQRKDRLERSFKAVDGLLARYNDLAECLHLMGSKKKLADWENNRVLALGDWFDFVAHLSQRSLLDAGTLERSGFWHQGYRLLSAATTAAEAGNPSLKRAVQEWSHLAKAKSIST